MDERERELQIMAAAYEVVTAAHLIHGVYIVPENVMNVLGGLMLGMEDDSLTDEAEEFLRGRSAHTLMSDDDLIEELYRDQASAVFDAGSLDDSQDEDDFDIAELARAMPIRSIEGESKALSPQEFIRGGKATFTLTDENTGKHFTYRINKWQKDAKSLPRWYVNLGISHADSVKFCQLQGMAQLNAERTHVNGLLNPTDWVVSSEAPSRKLFERFIHALNAGVDVASHDIRFQHAGRCCVCARELTNPESIEYGIGPECMGKMGME